MRRLSRRVVRLCVLVGIGLAIPYVGFCALLAMHQRGMLYQPGPGPAMPAEAGVPAFTRHVVDRGADPPLVYWAHEAPGPILIYFPGNGGGLHTHVGMLAYLGTTEFSIAALQYPGSPGADGAPTQALITDLAVALYDTLRRQHPDRPIVTWGFSLGSAVAVQLAVRRPTATVVLEAPVSAVIDIMAERMRYVPMGLLVQDRWLSREVIADLGAPLLILHGERDGAVPIHHAEMLLARAREPKSMLRVPDHGHNDLGQSGIYTTVLDRLRRTAGGG